MFTKTRSTPTHRQPNSLSPLIFGALLVFGSSSASHAGGSTNWSVTPVGSSAGPNSPGDSGPVGRVEEDTLESGDFSEAQSKLSKATVDYYHALKAGRGKTPADREVLWKKLVEPSEVEAQKAQAKLFRNQRKSPFVSEHPEKGEPSGKPQGSVDGETEEKEVNEPNPARPVFKLDGTNIPKEMNFSPENHAEKNISSSSSSSPSPNPKVKRKKKRKPKITNPHNLDKDSIPVYQ